ncbi:MAG: YdcF family protein [Pseudomonadota bacterium]
MSFIISKIFWVFIQPSNLLLLTAVVAALSMGFWPRLGRRLLSIVVVFLVVITFIPVGQWLMVPVEQRFPERTAWPETIDGIIVLGGGVDVGASIGRDHLELNASAERLTVSAELAKAYPSATLIYSGYRGRLVEETDDEPDLLRFYTRRGIEAERLIVETESRNTFENVILSKALAKPAAGDVWLIVTSASHMPRAIGIFRKVDWPVLPVPVDFRQAKDSSFRSHLTLIAQPHVSNRLQELDRAVKEWTGLTAYWLMGRTSSLLPGPD